VDVLVNNAGSARWRDLDEVPDEDWYAAWELNVMAPMRLMRASVPGMRERGWGRIVNVSSTAGKRPSSAMAEYSVAKAAELSLSRLYADRSPRTASWSTVAGPGRRRCGWRAGSSTSRRRRRPRQPSRRRRGRLPRPIGRLAEVEEVALGRLLCSEQAFYVAGAA
jgi:NAD(P)-dependent dehydrogenase (short-subunit alcohol dehydrogenase family)